MFTKQALAAAAVLGLAGALLSPPALAIVSVGSSPVGTVQTMHSGILLAAAAEEGKKKATKTKTKATKAAKKPATKGKAKGTGAPSGGGGGEYE
jgi:hypothetical protein